MKPQECAQINKSILNLRLKTLFNIAKLYIKLIKVRFKLKSYSILSPSKITKITKYKKLNDEIKLSLAISKKQFKFLFCIKRQIKLWLDSKDFKEKYLDTNHPYPPLLNPNDIDYKSIPAELAWELNLPLPPNYDLIIISGSNMGHNALLDFLTQCGAKRGKDHLPKDLQTIYTSFYDFLVNPNNTNDFKILPFVQYDYLDYTEAEFSRYCSFFSNEVPILVQVRDPLIKLLLVNNYDFKPNLTRNFTLNDNLPQRLDIYDYMYDLDLQKALKSLITPHNLRQSTAIKGLNTKIVDFIDTDNELMPNNAYETIKKLAKKYHLKEPQDKAFFECIMEEELDGLLNLNIKITHNDACQYLKIKKVGNKNHKVDILFTIYPYVNIADYVDISTEIWDSNWLYKGADIRLFIKKDEYRFFDEVMKKAAIKYFAYFKVEFMKRIEIESQKRFTSQDILEYLKKDKALSKKLKTLLDKELECVKQMRPDIVDSWHFYKRFESMCQTL